MKYPSILFLALFPAFLFGQSLERQVIASTGNYATATGLQVSSTVGETQVSPLSSTSLVITQGFQQPLPGEITSVEEDLPQVSLHAYPNPVQSEITIEMESDQSMVLELMVLDMRGRRVLPETQIRTLPGQNSHRLDLSGLAAGQYLVVLHSPSERLGTLKVMKTE